MAASQAPAVRTASGRRRRRLGTAGRHVVLAVFCAGWLIPVYLVVVNAFKSQGDILGAPFSLPFHSLSLRYMRNAITNPDFNVVKAYGATLLFVVLVDFISVVLCGPAAYVIARKTRKRYQVLLYYFVFGTFIPPQAILIPLIYVLRTIGLMNTVPGLVAFQAAMAMPITMFLYVGYIRAIPRELDEAAHMDGSGQFRTFWRVIFPLMRPVVATSVILTTMGVWNDFVDPYLVLGPASPLKTVTTGIYAAIGQYEQNYTVVFPDLLLVIAPVLIFFVLMQRHIVSGLMSGATK